MTVRQSYSCTSALFLASLTPPCRHLSFATFHLPLAYWNLSYRCLPSYLWSTHLSQGPVVSHRPLPLAVGGLRVYQVTCSRHMIFYSSSANVNNISISSYGKFSSFLSTLYAVMSNCIQLASDEVHRTLNVHTFQQGHRLLCSFFPSLSFVLSSGPCGKLGSWEISPHSLGLIMD